MSHFAVLLGWVFFFAGLLFGLIHIGYGIKNIGNASVSTFCLSDFLMGKNRQSLARRSSVQLFAEGVMGIAGSVIIYFILLSS